MFRIHVVPADGQSFDYPFEGESVVVGRSSASDLVLADKFLSRKHARLFLVDGAMMVEDLGSRNGTLLNGTPVQQPTRVEPGDVIKLSGSMISLQDDEHPSSSSKSGGLDMGHTVFRDASDLMQSASSIGTTTIKGEAALRNYADRLRMMNEVHQALNESLSLDELLEMILDRVFEHLQPEQGVVFIKDSSGGIRPAAQRSVPGLESEYLYSTTLVQEVTEKGLAALVLDVASDDRFAQAASIVASGVRSLVAAPLLGPEGSLGMIALNSRLHVRQFSEEDMELLTSLAAVAAMRIRNVALAEEAAERRRLEEELALARRIQVGLLPDELPSPEGWEIYGGNVPSRGVSGDYYQVIERHDLNELVVMIADVSGKGMGASILTASLEALAAGPIEVGYPPSEICDRVSRRLFDRTPPEKYATGFLVCLKPRERDLRLLERGPQLRPVDHGGRGSRAARPHRNSDRTRPDGQVPTGGEASRRGRYVDPLHGRLRRGGGSGGRGVRARADGEGLHRGAARCAARDLAPARGRPARVRQGRAVSRRSHPGHPQADEVELTPPRQPTA